MKQKLTDLAIEVRKEMAVELMLRLIDWAMSIPPEWRWIAAVVALFAVLVVLVAGPAWSRIKEGEMSSDSAYWQEISRLSNAAGEANDRLVKFLEGTPRPNTADELAEYDTLVADLSSAHDEWRSYSRRK